MQVHVNFIFFDGLHGRLQSRIQWPEAYFYVSLQPAQHHKESLFCCSLMISVAVIRKHLVFLAELRHVCLLLCLCLWCMEEINFSSLTFVTLSSRLFKMLDECFHSSFIISKSHRPFGN